jgi:protein SCO1/2
LRKTVLLLLTLLLSAAPSSGHETTATKADIGLEEKLGQYIPAGAAFVDEHGNHVDLKNSINKPTIIAPVYLSCMHECPMLLTGLAEVLGKLELVKPGRDFQVITLSFDEHDKPALALDKKRNYLKAVGKPTSESSLTQSASNSSATVNMTFHTRSRSSSSRPEEKSCAISKA